VGAGHGEGMARRRLARSRLSTPVDCEAGANLATRAAHSTVQRAKFGVSGGHCRVDAFLLHDVAVEERSLGGAELRAQCLPTLGIQVEHSNFATPFHDRAASGFPQPRCASRDDEGVPGDLHAVLVAATAGSEAARSRRELEEPRRPHESLKAVHQSYIPVF
jgi:hypothetical protein